MAFPWDLALPCTAERRAERGFDPDLEYYFGREDPRAVIGRKQELQRAEEATRRDGDGDSATADKERAVGPQQRRAQSAIPAARGTRTSARRPESATTRGPARQAREKTAVERRRRRPDSACSVQGSPPGSAANRPNTQGAVCELSARRIRDMIPEELRAVCKAHSLPPTGSTSEMRGRLMALLPKRKASAAAARSLVDSSNPGYRPSRQHLAAADSAHARGTDGAGITGGAALAAARVRLARPIAIAQLSLQDIRHRASTSLDFLRGGKIAVLLFWATGVGGGVDPNAKKWSGSTIPHDP